MIADILSKYQETELKEDDEEGLEINLDNDKIIEIIINNSFCDEDKIKKDEEEKKGFNRKVEKEKMKN